MIFNKKLAVAVSGAVLLMAGQFALADSTTDIVDALVGKGVLTEEEGKLITKGHDSKKKADEKVNKARVNVGGFIDNAQLYGDMRARYERRDGRGNFNGSSDSDTQEANRARYKFTLGVKTESGAWSSDIAFAASPKGTSDNVTFGNAPIGVGTGLDAKAGSATAKGHEVYVKRAQVGYKPFDWLQIEAGRMANPLYSVNAMVFDRDIVFEGLQEKFKYKFGETEVFANLGQWITSGSYSDLNNISLTNASTVIAYQAGAMVPLIDKKSSAKGAVSWYSYGGTGGGVTQGAFSPFLATSTNTVRAGITNTSGVSYGVNDLQILDIPAEFNYLVSDSMGMKLYGEYAINMDGRDRYNKACALSGNLVCDKGDDHNAWLLGVVFGSASDLKSLEGGKLKQGQWNANLWYQSVGAYALDPNSVDSDIFDGRVNMEGTSLKAAYMATDGVALKFTGAWGSRKNNNLGAGGSGGDIALNLKDYTLYQFDVEYKF